MYKKIFFFACLFCMNYAHSEISLRGDITLQQDGFLQNSQFVGQRNQHGPLAEISPEFIWQSDTTSDRVIINPFLALSTTDSAQNRFDLRRASYLTLGDEYEFEIGVSQIFWGVTESRHLVDIVNQTDFLGNLEGEDKLGQPMVLIGRDTEYGYFQGFVMPYFRERQFPNTQSRLRFGTVIDGNDAYYVNGAGQYHPDVALRYENNFDEIDLGVHYFYGTDREPLFRGVASASGINVIPVYDTIHRTGIDIQYTSGGWLLKGEGIAVKGHGDMFYAASAGFEYSFYGVNDSDWDIGLLAEYHYDDRDNLAPISFYDNDAFVGMRVVPNDTQDTELLAGLLYDTNNQGNIWSLEASRRLTNNVKISLDGKIYEKLSDPSGFGFLNNEDLVRLRLSYYF